MKYIEFHGIDLKKMNSDQMTEMFERIQEELHYHKSTYGRYPTKTHVYPSSGIGWLAMINSDHPKNHMVICA